MFKDSSKKLCTFCGEILKSGAWCPTHRAKEGRIKDIEKQLEIEKERGTKTQEIFGKDRRVVLKEHGLDENL